MSDYRLNAVAFVLCFAAGLTCAASGEAWRAFAFATIAGVNACWLAYERGRGA